MTTVFKQFRDVDMKFEPHPATGDLIKKEGLSAIAQSIRNLVLTSENELVGDLEIFGGVNRFLFQNKNPVVLIQLKKRIEDIIKNYEPRAELNFVNIKLPESDRHAVEVTVSFYALNLPDPHTMSIELTRVR